MSLQAFRADEHNGLFTEFLFQVTVDQLTTTGITLRVPSNPTYQGHT